MLTAFHSAATSGFLGLAQLHGGRGLLIEGILGSITGGPVKLSDPYGDFVIGADGPAVRFATQDHPVKVFDLKIDIAPTTADWVIFYRLV